MSNPANFNGQRPVINPDDALMLLIDHQSGLFQTVGDMPMTELRARAAVLAKMATLANIPDHHRLSSAGSEWPADPGNSSECAACSVYCP